MVYVRNCCVCSLYHLKLCSDDIIELERKHATTMTKVAQARRKLKELSTRVLKVLYVHVHMHTSHTTKTVS